MNLIKHICTFVDKMPKISLIGCGQIGALVGQLCLQNNLGDLQLYDVAEGIPQGKCLDLKHFSTILNINKKVEGSNNIEDIQNSDIIVITAGLQRKEGMTREDLIGVNGKIIKSVAENVKKYSPNAFVIVVSNPLDVMVNLFYKYSKLPHHRVCGMAGILDTCRFRTLLADKLNVSPENVNAIILGGHGDLMVPLQRYCSVQGIPLTDFINQKLITQVEVDEIVEKTKNGGAEIIKLAKMSAAFAPAAAVVKMIKSYLYNQNQLFTCAVYLNGQYKCKELFVGSTSIINSSGISAVEFPLTQQEQALYDKSIEHVKKNYENALSLVSN